MPITIRQTDFSDFEALQDVVQNGRSQIVQLGTGKMAGTLTHLSLGSNFGISTGSFSTGMRSRGVASLHRWTFGMVLETDGPASALQHTVKAGDLAVIAPGHDRYTSLRAATRYFAAFVDPLQLQAFLATQPGAQDAMLKQPTTVLTGAPSIAAANVKVLSTLVDALTEHGSTMSDDATDFYRSAVLEVLTRPTRDAARYYGRRARSTVKLVAEVDRYLIDAGNRPIHIAELCEKFNVGRRALHRAFDDVLGIPPITFLRRKRLGDVHTVLLQGGPELMVKAVAIEHGFLELGRFAGEYRKLFGEKPSETLRRRIRP